MTRLWAECWFAIALAPWLVPAQVHSAVFDVKSYGAKGDGKILDSPAINQAIEAASAAGGGTVHFPAGTYVIGSIRLRSNLTLQFEPGATLEASADPSAYDAPNQANGRSFRISDTAIFTTASSGARGWKTFRSRARPDQRQGARARTRRGRRQSHRTQALPQGDAARFFDSLRRPLRHPGYRRGQPDHRQRDD
jgi:hypothetical protein